jgi:hypothetical protein
MKILDLVVFIMLTSLFVFKCETNKNPVEPDFSNKVRIIPSKGVDGIEFGYTAKDVVSLLGETEYGSDIDGITRSWISKNYIQGKYAGLYVVFINKAGNDQYGPVDFFVIDPPYSGKTAEGIGIGSTVEDVNSIYGEPAKIHPTGSWLSYIYYFKGKEFELMTKDGVIKRMSLGFYEPMGN